MEQGTPVLGFDNVNPYYDPALKRVRLQQLETGHGAFLFTRAMLAGEPIQVFKNGNSNPTPLMTYIEALEQALGIRAEKQFQPMQPGPRPRSLGRLKPNTPVQDGVARFAAWYRQFYGV